MAESRQIQKSLVRSAGFSNFRDQRRTEGAHNLQPFGARRSEALAVANREKILVRFVGIGESKLLKFADNHFALIEIVPNRCGVGLAALGDLDRKSTRLNSR